MDRRKQMPRVARIDLGHPVDRSEGEGSRKGRPADGPKLTDLESGDVYTQRINEYTTPDSGAEKDKTKRIKRNVKEMKTVGLSTENNL